MPAQPRRPGGMAPSAPGNRRRPPAPSTRTAAKKRPVKKKPKKNAVATQAPAKASTKGNSLSKLLSPENLQETLKSVGTLRGQVKNWLRYLQQADQVLDTVFVTSTSLRESGVLDKIIKQRGKNLSTEDFTNILVALMNSPAGSQIFKSFAGGGNEEDSPNE